VALVCRARAQLSRHLTAALASGPAVPAPNFEDTVSRVLVGLLGQ
jgi:hypothetical protein